MIAVDPGDLRRVNLELSQRGVQRWDEKIVCIWGVTCWGNILLPCVPVQWRVFRFQLPAFSGGGLSMVRVWS